MSKAYFGHQIYEEKSYSESPVEKGEYENCTFKRCHFSHSDLSELIFSECIFKECDLSMAIVNDAAFKEVEFKECKLLGIHFDVINDLIFSARFEKCILNMSSFYKLDLRDLVFKTCQMRETDFTEADLSGVVLEDCDLSSARFEKSNLQKTDFRTAYNFSINPAENRIKGARFSRNGLSGLLDQYNIEIE